MNTAIRYRSLDRRVERRRRLKVLIRVVPALLNHLLKPVLGWRRVPFVLSMLMYAPRYRKAFAHPDDNAGLAELKRTFLLVDVLYNRLRERVGEEVAFRVTHSFIYKLGNAIQRQAYLPLPSISRPWEWFHQEHEAQIAEGFIRNNENDGIVHSDNQVSLHITRCRFFEAFHDMGHAGLAEAFCRSDETVFNEILPEMRFRRGIDLPDTLTRCARRCTFIYDLLNCAHRTIGFSVGGSASLLEVAAQWILPYMLTCQRSLPGMQAVRILLVFNMPPENPSEFSK